MHCAAPAAPLAPLPRKAYSHSQHCITSGVHGDVLFRSPFGAIMLTCHGNSVLKTLSLLILGRGRGREGSFPGACVAVRAVRGTDGATGGARANSDWMASPPASPPPAGLSRALRVVHTGATPLFFQSSLHAAALVRSQPRPWRSTHCTPSCVRCGPARGGA